METLQHRHCFRNKIVIKSDQKVRNLLECYYPCTIYIKYNDFVNVEAKPNEKSKLTFKILSALLSETIRLNVFNHCS